jgi:hypothetical protein
LLTENHHSKWAENDKMDFDGENAKMLGHLRVEAKAEKNETKEKKLGQIN